MEKVANAEGYNLIIGQSQEIVKKEIGRVINNANNITLKNSAYYRELLNIVTQFNDLTLIDWFVPIKLTFAKM